MLKATKFHLERKVAIDAVRKASKVCLQVFNSLSQGETVVKDDKSPVTGEEDSDYLRTKEGEKISGRITGLANSAFITPKTTEQIMDAIDKGNHKGGSSGRFWTLDPVDGTKGFLRGGQFAVCLALVVNGSVELGVLGCPNLPIKENDSKRGVLFVAERGNGAYQQPLEGESDWELIRMTKLSDISKARFCESVESGHSSHDQSAKIASLLDITSPPLRMDSQCKYGSISRGDGELYLRLPTCSSYQEKIWDHAAGCLLVEEAGGQVSDIAGRPLDFSQGRTLAANKGVIASHVDVHPELVKAVKSVVS